MELHKLKKKRKCCFQEGCLHLTATCLRPMVLPPLSSLVNDLLYPSERPVDKRHLLLLLGTSIHLDGRLRTTPPWWIFFTFRLSSVVLFCVLLLLLPPSLGLWQV